MKAFFNQVKQIVSSLFLVCAIAVTSLSSWANLPQALASDAATTQARQALVASYEQGHVAQQEQVFKTVKHYMEKVMNEDLDPDDALWHLGWVVLDLDETVLDNRAYFIQHAVYQPALFAQWVEKAEARAMPGAISFIEWLYQQQVPFAFISGRRESQRVATVKNLKALGIPTTVPLLLKPNTFPADGSAVTFKQTHRCALEAQTNVSIWLLIGDQSSDLTGQCNGKKQFKMPNLLYTIS
jgi:predicted secreted acid phosphatase